MNKINKTLLFFSQLLLKSPSPLSLSPPVLQLLMLLRSNSSQQSVCVSEYVSVPLISLGGGDPADFAQTCLTTTSTLVSLRVVGYWMYLEL